MILENDKKTLKEYFITSNNIAFAFLFGSQARRNSTKLSDVDIAVYFYPEKGAIVEYEEEAPYEKEDDIWSDLEKILKREVEMLVLNRVSATVAATAIKGLPLAINDWGLYIDFMLIVSREAADFMDFIIRDYREKKELEKRV
ncbi:MAG: type VII toxin-antitoxin system MntA family adenylyltransferase antitoxin [Candidatus Anammoxibacter sp.]